MLMMTTTTTGGEVLLLAHAASTLAMAGVIWFVQVVHYPLFAEVAAERFAGYEASHRRLTTRVVAPLMLVELATTAALPFRPAAAAVGPEWVPWAGLALLAATWLSTWLVQVPPPRDTRAEPARQLPPGGRLERRVIEPGRRTADAVADGL